MHNYIVPVRSFRSTQVSLFGLHHNETLSVNLSFFRFLICLQSLLHPPQPEQPLFPTQIFLLQPLSKLEE
jgi:hypothetical protein